MKSSLNEHSFPITTIVSNLFKLYSSNNETVWLKVCLVTDLLKYLLKGKSVCMGRIASLCYIGTKGMINNAKIWDFLLDMKILQIKRRIIILWVNKAEMLRYKAINLFYKLTKASIKLNSGVE